ncbi:hypothetical protein Dimus_011169 [Dionaea muscipula]
MMKEEMGSTDLRASTEGTATIGVLRSDLISSPDLDLLSEVLTSNLEVHRFEVLSAGAADGGCLMEAGSPPVVVEDGALMVGESLFPDDGCVAEGVHGGGHVAGDELQVVVSPEKEDVFAGEQGHSVQPIVLSTVSSFSSSLADYVQPMVRSFFSSLSVVRDGIVADWVGALRPQPSDRLRQPPRSPVEPLSERVVGSAFGVQHMTAAGSSIDGEAPGRAQQLLPTAPMAIVAAAGVVEVAGDVSGGCCLVEEGPAGGGMLQPVQVGGSCGAWGGGGAILRGVVPMLMLSTRTGRWM